MDLLREERQLVQGHDEHVLPLSLTTGAMSTELGTEPTGAGLTEVEPANDELAGDEPAEDKLAADEFGDDDPAEDEPAEDDTNMDVLRGEGQSIEDHAELVFPPTSTTITENIVIRNIPASSLAEKSLRRKQTYVLILMLPSIIILLLWILVWGDSLTLKDAYVPFVLSIWVTQVVVASMESPYSHRKAVYILVPNLPCIIGLLVWIFVLGHSLALGMLSFYSASRWR